MSAVKYNEKDISVLSDREHVRARPTMYIGQVDECVDMPVVDASEGVINVSTMSVNPGVFTCFREIVDNCVDIITMTKVGDTVTVDISDDGMIRVSDNSVGVPTGINDKTGKHTPEVVYSTLKSGKNFKAETSNGIGTNGMGASIVALMSERFEISICRDKKSYAQIFVDGVPETPVIQPSTKGTKTGTSIGYKLDMSFFPGSSGIDLDFVKKYLTVLKTVYPEITFMLNGEEVKNDHLLPLMHTCGDYMYAFKVGEGNICSVVNSILTYRHGAHFNAFGDAIHCAVGMKDRKLVEKISRNDVMNHIDIFIIYKSKSTTFDTQNKSRLTGKVSAVDGKSLLPFVVSSNIIQMIEAMIETKAVKKAVKDNVKERHRGFIPSLPETKADKIKKKQLYITEGRSAIGTFRAVRKPGQAGLSIQGKILSVLEEKESKIMANSDIRAILECSGYDVTKKKFTPVYDDIIITTDADPDGYHIACLIVMLYMKYCPHLVEEGVIKHLLSPLYSVEHKGDHHWFNSKAEVDVFSKGKTGIKVKYNKGLGGMSKEEWVKMITVGSQPLTQISADELIGDTISSAFSEKSADTRKEWLSAGTKMVIVE
jgi:DNA gyrase/topoisomerase IV subunit B